jgi:hypothetical protein
MWQEGVVTELIEDFIENLTGIGRRYLVYIKMEKWGGNKNRENWVDRQTQKNCKK